jgi:hypothetical protein
MAGEPGSAHDPGVAGVEAAVPRSSAGHGVDDRIHEPVSVHVADAGPVRRVVVVIRALDQGVRGGGGLQIDGRRQIGPPVDEPHRSRLPAGGPGVVRHAHEEIVIAVSVHVAGGEGIGGDGPGDAVDGEVRVGGHGHVEDGVPQGRGPVEHVAFAGVDPAVVGRPGGGERADQKIRQAVSVHVPRAQLLAAEGPARPPVDDGGGDPSGGGGQVHGVGEGRPSPNDPGLTAGRAVPVGRSVGGPTVVVGVSGKPLRRGRPDHVAVTVPVQVRALGGRAEVVPRIDPPDQGRGPRCGVGQVDGRPAGNGTVEDDHLADLGLAPVGSAGAVGTHHEVGGTVPVHVPHRVPHPEAVVGVAPQDRGHPGRKSLGQVDARSSGQGGIPEQDVDHPGVDPADPAGAEGAHHDIVQAVAVHIPPGQRVPQVPSRSGSEDLQHPAIPACKVHRLAERGAIPEEHVDLAGGLAERPPGRPVSVESAHHDLGAPVPVEIHSLHRDPVLAVQAVRIEQGDLARVPVPGKIPVGNGGGGGGRPDREDESGPHEKREQGAPRESNPTGLILPRGGRGGTSKLHGCSLRRPDGVRSRPTGGGRPVPADPRDAGGEELANTG